MSEQRSAEQSARLTEQATEEIRALLARRKLSAAKLADKMGKTQTYLSRRMTGEVALDLDDLEIIARELNVTVVQLLGGRTDTTVASSSLTDHPMPGGTNGPLTASRMIPAMRRPVRIEQAA